MIENKNMMLNKERVVNALLQTFNKNSEIMNDWIVVRSIGSCSKRRPF